MINVAITYYKIHVTVITFSRSWV